MPLSEGGGPWWGNLTSGNNHVQFFAKNMEPFFCGVCNYPMTANNGISKICLGIIGPMTVG